MCGITGIYAFNQVGAFYMINLGTSMVSLTKRGPDQRGTMIEDFVAFGHTRLSIIDPSFHGKQPMEDPSGNYVLIFNGEIFNYKSLRKVLEEKGITFISDSDTEVLLHLFIEKKEKCLDDLVGFFSFAVYNRSDKSLFLARDRFGIKPLVYFHDEDKFIFSSELKALLTYNIPKEIDYNSLQQYLHLNYIPAPYTILKNIYKVEPATYLWVKNKKVEKVNYYNPDKKRQTPETYEKACKDLYDLMDQSVTLRMVSDVPLGAFLSGGVDSSIIAAIASAKTDNLQTFTIGYKDEKYFDESAYAGMVAKKYNTQHTVFSLSNRELYENFSEALEYIDEPFADSSALAVYILSKKTRQHVKVALSGDGADEIFGGYNKHRAEWSMRNPDPLLLLTTKLGFIWKMLPQSRSSKFGNLIRQLDKLARGKNLGEAERYYQWAGFSRDQEVSDILSPDSLLKIDKSNSLDRKKWITRLIKSEGDFNQVLRSDLELVLPNDMLFKTDMMSMANSLEVRVPFLDHRIVEFAYSLPSKWKVNKKFGKQIVRDTFQDLLPPEILNRSKKGFEVPMLKWLKSEMKSVIEDDLLAKSFIREQNIFNYEEIDRLKRKLFSSNPGDSHARIWGLIVFQSWYKRFFSGK